MKYTIKYRNKKDAPYGNLFDIKIDLKNLNQRQICGLFIGLTGQSNAPFKEEEQLFHEFENCANESSEMIFGIRK